MEKLIRNDKMNAIWNILTGWKTNMFVRRKSRS